MGTKSKSFSLLLVVTLAVSSLIMVESASASIPKPSVPEFKISYTNYVYDKPPATSQWSGEPIPDTVNAQQTTHAPNIEFQKEYSNQRTHDNRTESLSNLLQTIDGGYAFLDLGWAHSVTLQPATFYKINPSGEIHWQKTIDNFLGKNLIQTSDGGYELSGRWSSYPLSGEVSTIIKTDSNGEIQWVQNYTTPYPPVIFDVSTGIQTSDGGFAYLQSGSLIKTDSSNQTQWTIEFTPNSSRWFREHQPVLFSLIETSDGAIAVLGVDNPFYGKNVWGSVYLVKTEPFLPIPPPTTLPTPIPTTPTIGSLMSQLTAPIITVIVLVGIIIYLLLFRRHRKTVSLSK